MEKIILNRGMKQRLVKELKTSLRTVNEALCPEQDKELTPKHLVIRSAAKKMVTEYLESCGMERNAIND